MNGHESFQIMCAWVAAGRASVDDFKELAPHLRECDECRQLLSDFAQLSGKVLPAQIKKGDRIPVPAGMTKRFIERAGLQGIPLHPSPSLRWLAAGSWQGIVWAGGAAALVLAGIVAMNSVRGPGAMRLRRPASEAPIHTAAPVQPSVQSASTPTASQQQVQARAFSDKHEIDALKSMNSQLQQQLSEAASARAVALDRLAAVENENAQLRLHASKKDSLLSDLEAKLKREEASSAEKIAALVQRQTELEDVRAQLAQRESRMKEERRLLAASAQARDLIVARNLHIIDVHDNDRSGRQRPFGRIFYTEGQSLAFYAYDLDAAVRRNTNVSFHVWGGKLGGRLDAKNLGIFRSEDTAAGRWVLTCDDPYVLAEINTVFVTMESGRDDTDHPKGRRILYAFLGDPANHP